MVKGVRDGRGREARGVRSKTEDWWETKAWEERSPKGVRRVKVTTVLKVDADIR